MDEGRLNFNGVNGATGGYLLPAITAREVAQNLRGWDVLNEVRRWLQKFAAVTGMFRIQRHGTQFLSLEESLDHRDLAAVGWGVVFAPGIDPAVREALQELLEHRKRQAAGPSTGRYQELTYQTGESRRDFLNRHEVGYDLDLRKVPYYLLLVGDPASIPFRFQQQLDVQYAVGRIFFETPEEYAAYARGVVASEKGGRLLRPPRSTFFGVRNPDDPVTEMSADYLVEPLAETLTEDDGYLVETVLAEEATKARLDSLLRGEERPDLLFSASHGMGFPAGDERQLPAQGAFLCQDWPGPNAWSSAIPEDHFFAAHDVGSDARLDGLICFHFGCYGAGTPRLEGFAHKLGRIPESIAPESFVARLPQRLLGHPNGGALAVIAHVDRSWGFSFLWPGVGEQLQCFESSIRRLLAGDPVGLAVEPFNRRYANLSADLSRELEDVIQGRREVEDKELVQLWTATNDARSYVVLGDPAVRLPVDPDQPWMPLPQQPLRDARLPGFA